jgi:hypothetical protein
MEILLVKRYGIIAATLALASCTAQGPDADSGDLYGNDTPPGDEGEGGGGDPAVPTDPPLPTPLRVVAVDNVDALTAALANAEPGDLIELRDQVWTLSAPVAITRSGTADHPIVISAQTVGGATIAGTAGFRPIGVSHVVVRGFDFRFSAGARALDCRDCSNVRFTRNHFELAPLAYSHWLVISGTSHDNRIDRNAFVNKATSGNFVTIDGTNTQVATRNVVELNYFANQTWGGTNEGECVRVGWSGLKYSEGHNVIERNLFEHCDGDPEIVSVKSSNNAVRFNTFRSNAGALVFRHGHRSQAIGNFFFDNNGGVRVYGDDHRIANNYFEANRGTGVRTTIVIGSGTVLDDAATASDGYDASERVVVALNTLVANASNFQIGNSSSDPVAATECTIADNLVTGDSGVFARSVRTYSSFTWAGNILAGAATIGDFPTGGYARVADPRLISTGGFMHLASDSPARDAAVGSYPDVGDDIDGTLRSGKFDTGADEYSTEAVVRRPLHVGDVGPAAP